MDGDQEVNPCDEALLMSQYGSVKTLCMIPRPGDTSIVGRDFVTRR
jgi:hypothetical protein